GVFQTQRIGDARVGEDAVMPLIAPAHGRITVINPVARDGPTPNILVELLHYEGQPLLSAFEQMTEILSRALEKHTARRKELEAGIEKLEKEKKGIDRKGNWIIAGGLLAVAGLVWKWSEGGFVLLALGAALLVCIYQFGMAFWQFAKRYFALEAIRKDL